MARILLTGSSGYIGRHLALRLKRQGHEVAGLDRERGADLSLDDFIQCDLLDCDRYISLLPNVDHIYHLAAAKGDWGISRETYSRDNVEATRALIRAAHAAGVKKWIFYSTVSVLGPSNTSIGEGAPRKPTTPYGVSKATCEELFDRYAAETPNSHVITIRPSVVFGPENPWNTNIFRLIDAIYRNRFVMVGRGREVKTTSYIDNLLDAHIFLLDHRIINGSTGHEIYHYVDAPAQTTASLVAEIRALLGKESNRLRIPLAIATPATLVGDALAAITGIDLPITSARVRKFCTATNFSAIRIHQMGFKQQVSNHDALGRTVDWYVNYYLTSGKRPIASQI